MFKNKIIRNIFRYLLYLFAIIGFIFVAVFFAMQFDLLKVKGSVSERNSYFNLNNNVNIQNTNTTEVVADWAKTAEWNLLKEVFTRDQAIINKAGEDAGISPRLILSGVMGEQLRFFGNRRESFKG